MRRVFPQVTLTHSPLLEILLLHRVYLEAAVVQGKFKNKKNTHRKLDRRETSRKEKRGENGVKRNKKGDKTVGQ